MNTVNSIAALTAVLSAVVAAPAWSANYQDKNARGSYLVKAFGCVDCHTPLKMGPNGPEPDLSRGLSGHPQDMALPPPPATQGPWIWGGAGTNTAFWGPWGVSYAANLTPDAATGLGSWSSDTFVKTMKTGKHLGVSRPIAPPMPWKAIGQLSNDDLKAIYRFLRAQPPIANAVPAYVPPQ